MSFTGTVVIILMVLIVAACVVAAMEYRKRQMRTPLGPEYDRLVVEHGGRRAADQELARRRREHGRLELRPISADGRRQFAEAWEHVQAGFLDDPTVALDGAARLVGTVLDARGYPREDAAERMALASVEHGRVLGDFREAETVAERVRSEPDDVSTEAMRVAVRQYRNVLFDLLGASDPEAPAGSPVSSAPRQEVQA